MAEDNPYLKMGTQPSAAEENPYLRLIPQAAATVSQPPTQTTSPATAGTIGMLNVFPAARQGVTPDIEQHRKNYLGAATVDEQGNVLIKGPNGLIPTVAGQHVVLQDPATGQFGVYAKTPETSENPAVSAARMISQGMLTTVPKGAGLIAAGRAPSPTIEALKKSYTSAIESPEVTQATVRPQDIGRFVGETQQSLGMLGPQRTGSQIPSLAPRTNAILGKLQESGGMSYGELDSARRLLGDIAGASGEEGKAATVVKKGMDKFLTEAEGKIAGASPVEAAIQGSTSPIAEAQATMQGARANYARAMAAQALDKKLANATVETGAANSGMNLDNKLRQAVTSFLKTDDAARLDETERASLQAFVKGQVGREGLRWVSNLLGGGGGLGTVVSADVLSRVGEIAGGSMGATMGAIAGVSGHVLKRMQNAVSASEAARISDAIRSNSPLGRQLQASFEAAGPVFKAVSENRYGMRAVGEALVRARAISNNLKSAGINISPEQIMKQIQGPVRGGTQQEQPESPGIINQ